jgi:hypothetical protein
MNSGCVPPHLDYLYGRRGGDCQIHGLRISLRRVEIGAGSVPDRAHPVRLAPDLAQHFHVTTKLKCEVLEELRREAKAAVLRAKRIGRFSQYGAAERQKEAQQKVDALIQHLLAGHDGKPCPAGEKPIVKPC